MRRALSSMLYMKTQNLRRLWLASVLKRTLHRLTTMKPFNVGGRMVNEARLNTHNEVSAEKLKKLPVGTIVIVHSFDRRGEHQQLECKLVYSGKKKVLIYDDYWGRNTKPITKESDRKWYSLS